MSAINLKKKARKRRRDSLPIPQWEEIKGLYIRGDITLRKISEDYKVNIGTLQVRSSRENWSEQKKEFWEEARERIRENIIHMFVEAGLPPQKLIKLVVEGAIRTTKLQNIKSAPIVHSKTTVKGKVIKLKPFTLDETIEVTDNTTTLQYRELAIKLLDMFPPPKASLKINPEDDEGSGVALNVSFSKVQKKKI